MDECREILDLMQICVGDKVSVYMKGFRGVVSIEGEVKKLSNYGLMIEDKKGHKFIIRYSEIKMIEIIEGADKSGGTGDSQN